MSWYYADNKEPKGPFAEDEFAQLIQDGRVHPETLVWSDGMAEWKPYGSLAADTAGADQPAPQQESVCSVCGLSFAPQDLIQFETAKVCANCKPLFLQKLKEDAVVPMDMDYAGFWIRFVAVFVDGILLSIVNYGLYFGVLLGLRTQGETTMTIAQISVSIFQMLLSAGYEIWMIGKYGATIGKMACKLKVVMADGSKLTYGRATGRYFSKILSQLILMIGYIMAGFDSEKRALHDMICNTRVIKT